MTRQILTVQEEHHNARLDVFLTQELKAPSRTFVKGLIEEGRVLVRGKEVKPGFHVSTGDEIAVDVPKEGLGEWDGIEPEDIPLDIFYEDRNMLVINKPAGLLVHPATGVRTGTLVNALLHHCRKLSDVNEAFRPGIVHRLDRETSGLMLIAKDNKTHVELARQFEAHEIRKCYAAVVEGKVDFDEGMIDVPLGRHPTHFDKKAVSFDESAKEALTFYRVVRRYSDSTLVALFPRSGRTHQLRVHMRHLGHPVLGDDKYGKRSNFPRLALHARSIGLAHPRTGVFVEFSSPLPPEFLSDPHPPRK